MRNRFEGAKRALDTQRTDRSAAGVRVRQGLDFHPCLWPPASKTGDPVPLDPPPGVPAMYRLSQLKMADLGRTVSGSGHSHDRP